MKYLSVISSTLLLTLSTVKSDAISNWPSAFNQFFTFPQQQSSNNAIYPAQNQVVSGPSPRPITVQQPQINNNNQTPLSNNNNNNAQNSTVANYQELAAFLKYYGVDIGTVNSPKLASITPASNSNDVSNRAGLIENIGSNIVQQYMNQNAQLINRMLQNPNQPFNVQSLFNNPVGGAMGVLGAASGINTSLGKQNRNGPGVFDQVMQKGGSVTLFNLVDLVIEFLYNNQGLYGSVLSLAIQFLKLFPFLLDAVFRIFAKVNNIFNPSLLQLILKFLYNYQAHSPPNWIRLTTLLSIFLQKDIVIGAQVLRDIIALVGNYPI